MKVVTMKVAFGLHLDVPEVFYQPAVLFFWSSIGVLWNTGSACRNQKINICIKKSTTNCSF